MMKTIINYDNDELEENDELDECKARYWYGIPKKYKLKDGCVMVPHDDFRKLKRYESACQEVDEDFYTICIEFYNNFLKALTFIAFICGFPSTGIFVSDLYDNNGINTIALCGVILSCILIIFLLLIPKKNRSIRTIIKQIYKLKLR